MVVNDVPGEECRIALLENGRLDELYSERIATATNVSNIYKGRVVNVEPAIQAAFVDFGTGQNGFLHISDLHPRYFPGEEVTERVGKKIPRRERPPIQEALRRGDSILVQVIKEGIGTKGPTLTSYLSIPGRLMVMMPDMDHVGVSRRIDDEEKRREMRKTLSSLDLPENMGFILRTAGFGRTKTELKRDLAYLNRLWKLIEKRINTVKAPCELYVESDLLIRTIRDVLTTDISAIVVDSESAYQRARDFLSVIAPRSAPRLIRYARHSPIFHAFDIERQIDLIHERQVPLHSGGAIVIEQTEAMVAIDVNSGKSRSARDSESNAYHTNCEAVDEICRQLRLRDLGGLVCCDLIDMMRHDNRRAIEKRMRDNLARDRAKTTVTRISEFGVLELTRQRMRPSMRKAHYQPCPHCSGHGEIRTPESMGSEAIRHAAHLLQYERVRAVEVVCPPRVGSAFLGNRRRELVRLEDATGKQIRVRISEAMPPDRIDYYAYDDRSADVDVSRLPAIKSPTLEEIEREAGEAERRVGQEDRRRAAPGRELDGGVATPEEALQGVDEALEIDDAELDEFVEGFASDAQPGAGNGTASQTDGVGRKKRRRRRRRGGGPRPDAAPRPMQPGSEIAPAGAEASASFDGAPGMENELAPSGGSSSGEQSPRKKRRRRRGRRGRGGGSGGAPLTVTGPGAADADAESADTNDVSRPAMTVPSAAGALRLVDEPNQPPRKKRRRRGGRGRRRDGQASGPGETGQASADRAETEAARDDAASSPAPRATAAPGPAADAGATPATKPRRSLYASVRRRLAAGLSREARDRDD
jgi:ribonuclease E